MIFSLVSWLSGNCTARFFGAAICMASNAGCISTSQHFFPAYNVAQQYGGDNPPRLFFEESVAGHDFPALVPYAAVLASGDASREALSRAILKDATKLKADVVIVNQPQSQNTGSIYIDYGIGIGSIQPVYTNSLQGTCFRIARCSIGLTSDRNGMVTSFASDSSAKTTGILEGDTIVSINGVPWAWNDGVYLGQQNALRLSLKPGDELRIVWIRPGTGRMDGVCLAVANTGNLPAQASVAPRPNSDKSPRTRESVWGK